MTTDALEKLGVVWWEGQAGSMPLAFDSHALFGALLGAWLVHRTRHRLKVWMRVGLHNSLKPWQRMGTLLLSAGVGYLFTPLLLSFAPFLSSGVAAFVAAVVVIPISVKVMFWLDDVELKDLLQRWWRGS